jgi:cell division protein FtsB
VSDTIVIPTSVKEMKNWNGSCYNFDSNVCVTGTIAASGAIYSSDRNLKENIKDLTDDALDKVSMVREKSFNFISDDTKRKTYGVIAQDVKENGLDELVFKNEDGTLAVDYTSLMILKIAKLTKDNDRLVMAIARLEERINELESKLNNKD